MDPVRSLGLDKHVVELVPHRSEWARAFVEEEVRLRGGLSPLACEIEHVGSTSVPGLPAKPILDLAIGVASGNDVAAILSGLDRLGYAYMGDAGVEGGHVLMRESALHVRTHHLHVVTLEDPQWEAYLLFRDFLRRDASARDAYAAEKATLAALHPTDREAYTAAKDEIARRLILEARHTLQAAN
ncbi:MAG: GrpB family protein [Deltaproteobacteria bacterium]|nr:GrpB family protein [Deltaproteobacteria bacterium]